MDTANAIGWRLFPHGQFRARVLSATVRREWFIRLRWIIVAGTLGILGIERVFGSDFQRPSAVAASLILLGFVNLVWTAVGRWILPRSAALAVIPRAEIWRAVIFVNAQMIVDLSALTVILRFSGGVENPMAVFYLFHVIIAALLLRPLNALLQGVWGFGLFSLIAVGECTGWMAPHHPFLESTAGATLHESWLYVLSAMGVLAAGIFGTLYFTLQISSRLDEQETELYRANDRLTQSETSIRGLQQQRSRFMQTAAHQLKSPLTGIEMLAALVRDDVVAAEKCKPIAERIIGRCREALVQVTELLTLARVEDAAPSRHRSAGANVAEIVARVVERFAEQARSKGLSICVVSHAAKEAIAAVDPRDLEDCLGNLVDNAVKYTPSGGNVDVTIALQAENVLVSVRDTGMGIAEKSVEVLFEPFRRGNEALAAGIPGSGLGLAIVNEVVRQAGGKFAVKSEVGQGTEFAITLPRGGQSASPGRSYEPLSRTKGMDATVQLDRESRHNGDPAS